MSFTNDTLQPGGGANKLFLLREGLLVCLAHIESVQELDADEQDGAAVEVVMASGVVHTFIEGEDAPWTSASVLYVALAEAMGLVGPSDTATQEP